MKKEDIFDAITDIEEPLVEAAHTIPLKKGKRVRFLALLAAALVFCIVLTITLWPSGSNGLLGNSPPMIKCEALAEAEYPTTQGSYIKNDYDAYKQFLQKSLPVFLKNDNSVNRVISPMNIYIALGLLPEISAGNTQKQVLDLLGMDSVETSREYVKNMWSAHYRDTAYQQSIFANSVWLSSWLTYKQEPLDILAEHYYASSFRGTMGSKEYNDMFHNWLNEQTHNTLQDQVNALNLYPENSLALASTVYFRAKWLDEFKTENTAKSVFYAKDKDITCDFMNEKRILTYYTGKQFSAVAKELDGAGYMWFILPNQGIETTTVLQDPELFDSVLFQKADTMRVAKVTFQVPKFDFVHHTDLLDGLQELGVKDAFNPDKANFTPLFPEDGHSISRAQHDARVAIDEEGCVASALSVILYDGFGGIYLEIEEVDFILDRPFLFAITDYDGAPMFTGIVDRP